MDANDLYFLERAETKLKNDNIKQSLLPTDRHNPAWSELSRLLLINEKLVLQKHLEAKGRSFVLCNNMLCFVMSSCWQLLCGCVSNRLQHLSVYLLRQTPYLQLFLLVCSALASAWAMRRNTAVAVAPDFIGSEWVEQAGQDKTSDIADYTFILTLNTLHYFLRIACVTNTAIDIYEAA